MNYFNIWLHVKVVYFLLFSCHILYLDLCECVCVWEREREREIKLQSTNLTKLNFILPCNGKVSIYLPEIGDFKWELKNPLRSPVHSNIASGFSWIFFLWIEESIQRPSLIMLLLLSKSLFSMNYIYLTACLVEIRMVLCGLTFYYGSDWLIIHFSVLKFLKNKCTSSLYLTGSISPLSPGSVILCVLYKLSNPILVLSQGHTIWEHNMLACTCVMISIDYFFSFWCFNMGFMGHGSLKLSIYHKSAFHACRSLNI